MSQRYGFVLVLASSYGLACLSPEREPNDATPWNATPAPGEESGNGGDPGGDDDDDDDDDNDESPGSDDDDNHGEDDDGPKFDIGEDDGGNSNGVELYSLIWIANSREGTVSKIDTEDVRELARYKTGPGWYQDPSRTSVNLIGDVAVANRAEGSVTKIAAMIEDCVDRNGDGEIQTSTGPGDILDWEQDECMLWNHKVPYQADNSIGGPRAMAWDSGTQDPDSDEGWNDDARLWIGWRDQTGGALGNDSILRRIEGKEGVEYDEIVIPDFYGNYNHGAYGGACDKERNFWTSTTKGQVVRIDGESLEVTRWDPPEGTTTYGMVLDAEGTPWLAGHLDEQNTLLHLDPVSGQFEQIGRVADSPKTRGLAIDREGHVWVAANLPCSLIRYDGINRMEVERSIALPDCQEPVGIAIDVNDFVWVVDWTGNRAYRVDPESYETKTVEGLVQPYTYSDMTGAGLVLVVDPPVE